MSEVVDSLKALAYIGHEGQYRRGPGHVPYIEHPKAVVETLQRWGITDEDVLAAAWAHDLLEDTDVNQDDISNAGGVDLGMRILSYVLDLTYDPDYWSTKKEWLDDMAKDCCSDVIYIKAADRYCNTMDFLHAGRVSKAAAYLDDAKSVVDAICSKNARAKKDFDDLKMHLN